MHAMTAVVIRGTPYPVVLPKLRDPRLHLAATIISLQVIGQIGFHFRVSIAQILISLGTCALLEVGIAVRRQQVLMWPASAMLTGNGVAFVLRVPGTRHGDWWSTRGWWIFVATAAVSLLSKHVIAWRGNHIFNPSNIGLVLCFVILGSSRAEPLDFWWGPMSAWLVLALVVILAGGFTILSRLSLLRVALSFWGSFAAGIGVLAIAGHQMTARWHLGPISGFHLWLLLVTSPEVLVFLFFMITDPKTAPRSPRARVVYAVSIGLLAAALIAPIRTEYWSKVALLGSLALVCVAQPFGALAARTWARIPRRSVLLAAPAALAAYGALLVGVNAPSVSSAAPVAITGRLPPVDVLPSRGVQSQLSRPIARVIAQDLVASPGIRVRPGDRIGVWLEPGKDQDPPTAVAQLAGRTYRLHQVDGAWALGDATEPPPLETAPTGPVLRGYRLTNVAASAGLDFKQGSFRFGITKEEQAMMGGGVCWLDYDNDGWLDLFVVNNYSDSQYAQWSERGGAPTGALYRNVRGHFVDVTRSTHTDVPVRGEGCVAADFDGDGHTDLYVTTATNDLLFWNNGDGTFTEGARNAGAISFIWHAGAAVSDVNGDGRPDLFVAGYTNKAAPIENSIKGFPSNFEGVRDELFLNEGHRRFRDVAAEVGLDPKPFDHSPRRRLPRRER